MPCVLACGCTLSNDALGSARESSRDLDGAVAPATLRDASTPPPVDAPSHNDGGVPPSGASGGPTRDASAVEVASGVDDATVAAPDAAASCGGTVALALCWYLSEPGDSCDATCVGHGGFDDRSLALVGTFYQGGSAQSCSDVLHALGAQEPVFTISHYDGVGLGCHRWAGMSYWVDLPALAFFASYRSAPDVQIACACTR